MFEQRLRNTILGEEFDYVRLISALSSYAHPRDKITRLLQHEVIVRVKKGLYIFGPDFSRRSYSHEVLANVIYGPSYVSLQWALSFHGLIPERVQTVTSVTTKRDKIFETPVGRFTYRYLKVHKYTYGIEHVTLSDDTAFLMATREKALADVLALCTQNMHLATHKDLTTFLFEDMRMDEQALKDINCRQVHDIAAIYKHTHVNLLASYVASLNKKLKGVRRL